MSFKRDHQGESIENYECLSYITLTHSCMHSITFLKAQLCHTNNGLGSNTCVCFVF